MILGIGIDLLEVPRMERALQRRGDRLLHRLFTVAERDACAAAGGGTMRWAARFAAKEAVLKALGTGWAHGVGWHQVEILRNGAGRPHVRLSGQARRTAQEMGASSCHVSLTHQKDNAAAVAILEGAAGSVAS
jgi:holo-[acyl-carrier protein] synthase